MVEQVGSVSSESCPRSLPYPPNFADVIIRDPGDVGARPRRHGRCGAGPERPADQLPGSLDPHRGPRRRPRDGYPCARPMGRSPASRHRSRPQDRAPRLQRHACRGSGAGKLMSGSNLICELSIGRDGAAKARSILHNLESATTQRPFSDQVLAFAGEFARRLRRASRGVPELTALAHWMRKAELGRLHGEFESLGSAHQILAPRGVVFHVPPANVDTIFVYSWLLSVLVGNKNVIRLSSRCATSVELILQVFAETLREPGHCGMRGNTIFVRYGHDRSVTDALSAGCDVRVIWGGDGTVDAIRQSPLPPAAIELTFPDRRSIAVIAGDKVQGSDG